MATSKTSRDGGDAAPWLEKVKAALTREERKWRPQGRSVVQRYRDERERSDRLDLTRINMLWANTEILQSALFTRMPKPDVRRRFPDGKSGNSASRIAAETIERVVTYSVDTEDVENAIVSAIQDMLLPGRGVIWVTYDPIIEEPEEDDTSVHDPEAAGASDGDLVPASPAPATKPATEAPNGAALAPVAGAPTPGPIDAGYGAGAAPKEIPTPSGGRILSQRLEFDYVYWEDYVEGQCRLGQVPPWKARRHALPQEQFKRQFPSVKRAMSGGTYKLTDASDRTGLDGEDYVEVWEIWAIGSRQRIYVAEGYEDILNADNTEDPYGLEKFYPTPRTLRGVTTTDRQEPRPEFLLYQDQANELDRVTTRLHNLTEQAKWRGFYDSSIPDGEAPGSSVLANVSKQDDGVFLPHAQFQAIAQRGGIQSAFGIMPIDILSGVIKVLQERRALLIEEIFQVTGISDIIRGSTDPRETKGAQTIKAQFGSMRLQARQREVQRYVRDLYRIAGEIVAEHYTVPTLIECTGFDLPTAEEKQRLQMQVDMLTGNASLPAPPMAMAAGGGIGQPSAMSMSTPANIGRGSLGSFGLPVPMPKLTPPSTGPGGPPMGLLMGPGGPPMGQPGPPGPPPAGPPPASNVIPFPGPGGSPQQGAPTPAGPPSDGPPQPTPDIPDEVRRRLSMPTWEEVMAILRSDKLRGYRVDMESDTSASEDQDADKQRRVEALTAVQGLLEKAYMAAIAAPKTMPLIKELALFTLRTFKPARSLEQSVEDAFDELMRNPPPAPTPPGGAAAGTDPNVAAAAMAKVEVERQKMEADAQAKSSQLEVDKQDKVARFKLDVATLKSNNQIARDKKEAEAQRHADIVALELKKHDDTMTMQRQTSARDHILKAAAHNQSMVSEDAGPGPDTSPEQSPMAAMMAALTHLAEGQQQTAAMVADLVRLAGAPKRAIRGPDGRLSHIETVQ